MSSFIRAGRRALTFGLLALCVLLSPLAAGQGGDEPSTPPEKSQGEKSQGEEVEQAPRPTYAGPREAVEAFLDAMRDGDIAKALSTFEGWDGTLSDENVRLAQDLIFILLRVESIDLDRISAGAGSGYWSEERSPEGHSYLKVKLACKLKDGSWYLSKRSTLDKVDFWREQVEELPLNEEVIGTWSTLQQWHYKLEMAMPEVLSSRAFLIANWKWVGLLVLIFFGVVTDRVIRKLAGRITRRAADSQRIRLDSGVLLSFERPMGLLAGVVAFEFLLPVLGLEPVMQNILRLATSLITTVAAVWAVYRLVDVFCDYLAEKAARTANRFDDMLVPLARRTIKIFVVVVGIVFVASRLSEDLWGIVAGLGLGSIAVGFAARDSIENLFGTFTVLLDKPFQIGDWILVGDLEGTVEQVGFRSTRIRTFYNSLITVPNRTFISSSIDNMGERRYRRIRTTLGLTYDTPPEKIEAFCEGVRQIIRSHPFTRKDYYHVYLNAFGASSLDVMLYCFVAAPDWSTELREKHRLFADILRLAEGLGVSFAFPTQTLHVAKPEDLQHADRPASDDEGARRGREVADGIVEKTLQPFGGVGHVPPGVSIQSAPVGGDEGEG